MKDVCADCKHEKPGNPHFCKKYGIPIWTPKVYCVSKEPERGEDVEQNSGEQVRSGEDGT